MLWAWSRSHLHRLLPGVSPLSYHSRGRPCRTILQDRPGRGHAPHTPPPSAVSPHRYCTSFQQAPRSNHKARMAIWRDIRVPTRQEWSASGAHNERISLLRGAERKGGYYSARPRDGLNDEVTWLSCHSTRRLKRKSPVRAPQKRTVLAARVSARGTKGKVKWDPTDCPPHLTLDGLLYTMPPPPYS